MDVAFNSPEKMIMKQVRRLATRWVEKDKDMDAYIYKSMSLGYLAVHNSSKFKFSVPFISPQFPLLQCDNFQPLHWLRRSEPGSVVLAVRESWMRCENKRLTIGLSDWCVFRIYPSLLTLDWWSSYDKVTAACVEVKSGRGT